MDYAPLVIPPPITDPLKRLELWLHDWSNWMARYRATTGHAARGGCIATGGASKSFEELCAPLEKQAYQATDAAVEDLPDEERDAVWKQYGVGVVRSIENFEQHLHAAHTKLLRALKARHVLF